MKLTNGRPLSSFRNQRRVYDAILEGLAACRSPEDMDQLKTEYAYELDIFALLRHDAALADADYHSALTRAFAQRAFEIQTEKEYELCN